MRVQTTRHCLCRLICLGPGPPRLQPGRCKPLGLHSDSFKLYRLFGVRVDHQHLHRRHAEHVRVKPPWPCIPASPPPPHSPWTQPGSPAALPNTGCCKPGRQSRTKQANGAAGAPPQCRGTCPSPPPAGRSQWAAGPYSAACTRPANRVREQGGCELCMMHCAAARAAGQLALLAGARFVISQMPHNCAQRARKPGRIPISGTPLSCHSPRSCRTAQISSSPAPRPPPPRCRRTPPPRHAAC